jgi:uncharacterized HAD superfamily protein
MNKKTLTIGIDLDDVLLDFNTALCEFYNSSYGTNYKREDFTDFYLERLWNVPTEEVKKVISEFYDHDTHWNTSPMPGAVSAIQKLFSQNHNLVIITAKPDTLRDRTQDWLMKHFGEVFQSVHFVGHYHLNTDGKKRTKREVCDELGVDIFIDDSMDNVVSVVGPERPAFLIDSPWNQGDVPQNAKRVKGWDEIMGHF